MTERTQFNNHFSKYFAADDKAVTPEQHKRFLAVTAALKLIEAQALGGGSPHVAQFRDEVGPLADAIQSAFEKE